jgi:hypothetical protein
VPKILIITHFLVNVSVRKKHFLSVEIKKHFKSISFSQNTMYAFFYCFILNQIDEDFPKKVAQPHHGILSKIKKTYKSFKPN